MFYILHNIYFIYLFIYIVSQNHTICKVFNSILLIEKYSFFVWLINIAGQGLSYRLGFKTANLMAT